jgi:hypothetical protein
MGTQESCNRTAGEARQIIAGFHKVEKKIGARGLEVVEFFFTDCVKGFRLMEKNYIPWLGRSLDANSLAGIMSG